MRRHSQSGYTIIEIMLIVMIIGVLSAIVLPNYRSYAIRAKMSEVLLSMSTCKNVVSELYQSFEDPPGMGNWGCEQTDVSQYVSAITTTEFGTIRASLRGFGDGRLDSRELSLAPLDNTGSLPTGPGFIVRSWRCGNPADGTEISANYLPNSCRG
jgi:type IV pilus assembly protein PilA